MSLALGSIPTKYGDICGSTTNFLGRDWPALGKNKLEVKHGQVKVKLDTPSQTTVGGGNVMSVEVDSKNFRNLGVDVKATVENSNKASFAFTNNTWVKGLLAKVEGSVRGTQDIVSPKDMKLSVEYLGTLNSLSTATFDVAKSVLKADTTFQPYPTWIGGATVAIDAARQEITGYDVSAGKVYASPYGISALSVQSSNRLKNWALHLTQKVSPRLEVALSMPVDPTGNKIAYDLGARYVLSADTAVKGKINSMNEASIAITQQLQKGVELTAVSTVPLGTTANAESPKFGFGVKLAV